MGKEWGAAPGLGYRWDCRLMGRDDSLGHSAGEDKVQIQKESPF